MGHHHRATSEPDRSPSSISSDSVANAKATSFDYENVQLALVYDPQQKDAFDKFKKDHKDLKQLTEYINTVMGSHSGLRNPKNAADGLGSGILTIGTGVIGGVGSLVVEPVRGGMSGGMSGFCKGVVRGVGGLVALPCIGLGAGVVQIGRGIANTPNAHKQRSKGYEWNKQTRAWEAPITSLQNEAERLEFEVKCNKWASDELVTNMKKMMNIDEKPRDVVETEYYDLLCVPPNANQSEIKKSYMKLAMSSHPDKIAQDELAKGRTGPEYQNESGQLKAVDEAKVKFQGIAEAYHILSNPEQRKLYDLSGKSADGLDAGNRAEEDEYKFLFCSDELMLWIGEPSFMSDMEDIAEMLDDNTAEVHNAILASCGIDVMQFRMFVDKQTKKCNQLHIAMNLEKRLEPYLTIVRPDREFDSTPSRSSSLSKCLTGSEDPPNQLTQLSAEQNALIEQWEINMRQEVRQILNQRIGPFLMSMVGWVYCNRASRQLGKDSFLGHKAQKANFQAFNKKMTTYKKLFSQTHSMMKMNVNQLDGEKDEAVNPDMIPAVLETMFQLHGVYAMDQVTKQFKWFFKESLYKHERILRATALNHLGTIIISEVEKLKSSQGGKQQIDWMEHITEQQIKRLEKQDQEFMNNEDKYRTEQRP
eukprot:GHVH01007742.1.p1 GENE.GHVH01007742.1~~GHVH01007742.1.p1  ORF type:complete len:646 (+),score=111.93 GHVH01007742.1:46-1983(+)